MDLKEFTSPLPKPWLNIYANSVHTGPGGGGASSCVYSKTGLTSFSNTGALTSLSAGAAAVGSLTLPPLPVGAVVRAKAQGRYSSIPLETNQVNFLLNGGAVPGSFGFSTGPTVTITTLSCDVDLTFTVLPGGTMAWTQTMGVSGFAPFGTSQTSSPYNNAVSNTIDMAFDFTSVSPGNAWAGVTFYVEVLTAS